MENFAVACIAAFTLVACGHSVRTNETSHVSSSGLSVSVVGGDWHVRYQYQDDTCDTGIQEVSATSQDDAINQTCSLLTDDEANHQCARKARAAEFAQDCANFNPANYSRHNPDRHHDRKPPAPPLPDDVASSYDE